MQENILAIFIFLANNIISYLVYERTRRKIYLRLFLVGNTFALLCGIFLLIITIIKNGK